MKANCTECGTSYEVSESHKGSQMCCLKCDKFFRVGEKFKAPQKQFDGNDAFKKSLETLGEKKEKSIDKKLKSVFKQVFAEKDKYEISEPELKPEYEADPPKMSEARPELKAFDLIDDFLDPETDFDNEPEDVPAEYLDFLTVGLDIPTSDILEHHDKNVSSEESPQKEQ